MFEFEIGEKVRIKPDLENVWDTVMSKRVNEDVKKYMLSCSNQIRTVKERASWGGRSYLLVDEKGETDGFAWYEVFLELVKHKEVEF